MYNIPSIKIVDLMVDYEIVNIYSQQRDMAFLDKAIPLDKYEKIVPVLSLFFTQVFLVHQN